MGLCQSEQIVGATNNVLCNPVQLCPYCWSHESLFCDWNKTVSNGVLRIPRGSVGLEPHQSAVGAQRVGDMMQSTCMAFLNAVPLARVLVAALPSCHNTRDTAALRTMDSLHDGKLLPPPDRSNTILSCVADAGIPNMYKALFKVIDPPTAVLHLRPPRSHPLISHPISL